MTWLYILALVGLPTRGWVRWHYAAGRDWIESLAPTIVKTLVGDRVYETYRTTGRGNEVMASSYGLLDLTVYGRQEFWEDLPEGWPQRWSPKGGQSRWTAAGPPSGRRSGRARRRPPHNAGWWPFRVALPLVTALLSVRFGWSAGRRVGGPVTCHGG
jgi:Bacterial protein of unknown function (DUF899)